MNVYKLDCKEYQEYMQDCVGLFWLGSERERV